jgi:hypothetical protein
MTKLPMKRLIALVLTLTTPAACTLGPIKVEHEYGSAPKVHVDTFSENTKLRVRRDKVVVVYKKEF